MVSVSNKAVIHFNLFNQHLLISCSTYWYLFTFLLSFIKNKHNELLVLTLCRKFL